MITLGHNHVPPEIIPMKGKIKDDEVRLIAWIKSGYNRADRGMTILNKGCIPIPSWAKID